MDEMLSIALWIMIALVTTSFVSTWFSTQPGVPSGLGVVGGTATSINTSAYKDTNCSMIASTDPLGYAWCSSVGQITTPISNLVSGIWGLLTGWQNLINGIFGYNATDHTYAVPAGDLFAGLLVAFFSVVEIGAVIIILMRLAAIIRGVAGGFL